MTIDAQRLAFQSLGYNYEVAEALAEREVDPNLVSEGLFSPEELMDHFLEWNGICGFTGMITRAIDNLREVHGGEE